MFSIHRELLLALKRFELSKSLLLRFLSPGKKTNCKIPHSPGFLIPGFPRGIENMGRGSSQFDGRLESIHGGGGGGLGRLKMLLKNTCEGVHLLVNLAALSLQACKFTKNELFCTYFIRILTRF